MSKGVVIPKANYARTIITGVNRNIGLDVARAMCAVIVVVAHTNNYMGQFTGAYRFIFPIGYMIQDLFFGLSGYLVGTQIMKKINAAGTFKDLINFYKNRWIRTIPFYMIFLGINFLVFIYIYQDSKLNYFSDAFDIKKYVFFVQNFTGKHPTFFPEIWPLPIEEWSFLVLPIPIFILVILFRKALTKKQLILLLILEIMIVNGFRIHHILTNDLQTDWELRKVVVYRFDAMIYGFLAGIVVDLYGEFFRKHSFKLLVFGFLTCFLFYFSTPYIGLKLYQCLLFFLFPLLMSFTIPFFLFRSFSFLRDKILALLTHISLISYSILLSHLYLIQFSLLNIYQPKNFGEGVLFTIIYFIILLGFATTFFNYVERPILLLRKKQR